jgi:hypothetical protein
MQASHLSPSRNRTGVIRASGRSTSAAATGMAVAVAAALLVLTGPLPSGAQDATGTSSAGVVPIVVTGASPGGNVTCAEAVPSADLDSSERLAWQGNRLRGALPDGLEVVVGSDTVVSWTSTFPISAVIVKGGSAAHVYRYAPALLADGGLVAPPNSSGDAAALSNLTFCWDPSPDDEPGPDLFALCAQAAGESGPIVSFAGPIAIVDGAVDPASVPLGHELTFDPASAHVEFSAPFPVVAAITVTSEPNAHRFDPPTTTGIVPMSVNPGSGRLVLCGHESTTIVSLSCAQVQATLEIGPLPLPTAVLDPSIVPPPVKRLVLGADALEFESEVPVAGVMVTASDPVLHAFEPAVTAGVVPLSLAPEGEATVVFCLRSAVMPPGGGGGGGDTIEIAVAEAAVETPTPTQIASGGGPSPRTSLALFGVVLIALAGWTQLLPRR